MLKFNIIADDSTQHVIYESIIKGQFDDLFGDQIRIITNATSEPGLSPCAIIGISFAATTTTFAMILSWFKYFVPMVAMSLFGKSSRVESSQVLVPV